MLYWSYSGFDAAGAYAGEIDDPRRTYPKAMGLTVALVALTYSVPFLAGAGVDKPHYTLWADGYYPIIAQAIAGPALRSWFLLCGVLGNLGVYIAKITKNGFLLAGMADLGLAPPFFIEYVPLIWIGSCRAAPEIHKSVAIRKRWLHFFGYFSFSTGRPAKRNLLRVYMY